MRIAISPVGFMAILEGEPSNRLKPAALQLLTGFFSALCQASLQPAKKKTGP